MRHAVRDTYHLDESISNFRGVLCSSHVFVFWIEIHFCTVFKGPNYRMLGSGRKRVNQQWFILTFLGEIMYFNTFVFPYKELSISLG